MILFAGMLLFAICLENGDAMHELPKISRPACALYGFVEPYIYQSCDPYSRISRICESKTLTKEL